MTICAGVLSVTSKCFFDAACRARANISGSKAREKLSSLARALCSFSARARLHFRLQISRELEIMGRCLGTDFFSIGFPRERDFCDFNESGNYIHIAWKVSIRYVKVTQPNFDNSIE